MHRNVRWVLAALVALAAAFVAVGGPATAARWIDGGDIKPGSIDGRQIASGAISSDKLSRRARRALRGATGARGAAGPAGPAGAAGAAGQPGARGPAGALDVRDATGKTLGVFVGFYSSSYPQVLTAEGAIITLDGTVGNNYLYSPQTGPIFYKQPGCAGTGYAYYSSSYALQSAIVLESPAVPGSTIYVLQPGSPESFRYESYRSSSGCSTSSSTQSSLLPVRTAGVVPSVQKPLQLVPAS